MSELAEGRHRRERKWPVDANLARAEYRKASGQPSAYYQSGRWRCPQAAAGREAHWWIVEVRGGALTQTCKYCAETRRARGQSHEEGPAAEDGANESRVEGNIRTSGGASCEKS